MIPRRSNSKRGHWPLQQAMHASFSLGICRRLGLECCAVSKLQAVDPSNPLAQCSKLISNPKFPISEHTPGEGAAESKSCANRYVAFRRRGFALESPCWTPAISHSASLNKCQVLPSGARLNLDFTTHRLALSNSGALAFGCRDRLTQIIGRTDRDDLSLPLDELGSGGTLRFREWRTSIHCRF